MHRGDGSHPEGGALDIVRPDIYRQVWLDNGNSISFEPFQASRRKAFNGLALVIVRAKPGKSGNIQLTATSEGLKPAEISLEAR